MRRKGGADTTDTPTSRTTNSDATITDGSSSSELPTKTTFKKEKLFLLSPFLDYAVFSQEHVFFDVVQVLYDHE